MTVDLDLHGIEFKKKLRTQCRYKVEYGKYINVNCS